MYFQGFIGDNLCGILICTVLTINYITQNTKTDIFIKDVKTSTVSKNKL